MANVELGLDRNAGAGRSLSSSVPRVLITGVCRGVGNACAEVLAARRVQLILCDNDSSGLLELAETFEAAFFHCDVASEISVANFAATVLAQYPALDMVINAAGGGYERTLGMYRVSRALLPALRRGAQKLLVNIPPSAAHADAPIFPYVSSRLAFHRLSSALASETRNTHVVVVVGCPTTRQLTWVLPDSNAGTWAETCPHSRPNQQGVQTLAWQIASLLQREAASARQAS